jgi:hypothetical protein
VKHAVRYALAVTLAGAVSVACQVIVGLEEPKGHPDAGVATTDAGPPQKKSCHADGGRCFCDDVGGVGSVLKCVDFDGDEFATGANIGLERGFGPISADGVGVSTLEVSDLLSESAPHSLRMFVPRAGNENKPPLEGRVANGGAVAVDVPLAETAIQFSVRFGTPEGAAPDAAVDQNRTVVLAFVEFARTEPRALVFGIDLGKYILSVAADTTNPSTEQIKEAGVNVTDARRDYATFELSIEDYNCKSLGVTRSAVIRAPNSGVVYSCLSLGDVQLGSTTRVYFGGYEKDPTQDLAWHFDDIVIRRKPDAG